MRIAIRKEAERLVREHVEEAYAITRTAVARARQGRNKRMEVFLEKVLLEVARQQGREGLPLALPPAPPPKSSC